MRIWAASSIFRFFSSCSAFFISSCFFYVSSSSFSFKICGMPCLMPWAMLAFIISEKGRVNIFD
jgi:hypothetical protein